MGTTLSNVEEIFSANPKNNSGRHFGARIVFDNDGFLYLSFGDRGEMMTSQDLTKHNGTVIRLNDDGTVPSDNPFFNTDNAQPKIWSYGHRNIQGMSTHPETGEIWTHEHGPRGSDEFNVLKKGANYGWPLASFGIDYDGDIITQDTFAEGTERPTY